MSKRADQKIFKYPLFKVCMNKNVSVDVRKNFTIWKDFTIFTGY